MIFISVGLGVRNSFRPPKLDDSGDPQDSLMQVMKNLYDTGDDEMKRNIRKTW